MYPIFKFISKQSLQQGAGVIFDQGLYSLTNFMTGVLLARMLAKEAYGIYVLAMSLIVLFMGVQRAVISSPYTIHSPKYSGVDFQQYTGSVFLHQLVLLSAAIITGTLLSVVYFHDPYIFSERKYIFLTFAIAVAGVLLRDYVRSYLLARIEIWQSISMGVLINIVQLLILWIVFLREKLTINNAFLIVGICSFVPAVLYFLKNSSVALYHKRILEDFLVNIKVGRWMLGNNVVYVLISQSYYWLVAFFLNKSDVAVLGVTFSLANLLGPFLQGMNAFILPKMAHEKSSGNPQGIVRIMKKSIFILSFIYSLWLIAGVSFGKYLLHYIYSAKYSEYHLVLAILVVSSFISGTTSPLNTALDAFERPDITFRSLVAGLLVTLIVGAMLVYQWGIYGAVVGVLLSNMTNSLLRYRGIIIIINSYKTSQRYC